MYFDASDGQPIQKTLDLEVQKCSFLLLYIINLNLNIVTEHLSYKLLLRRMTDVGAHQERSKERCWNPAVWPHCGISTSTSLILTILFKTFAYEILNFNYSTIQNHWDTPLSYEGKYSLYCHIVSS